MTKNRGNLQMDKRTGLRVSLILLFLVGLVCLFMLVPLESERLQEEIKDISLSNETLNETEAITNETIELNITNETLIENVSGEEILY
jgi:hypothetical protein